MATNDFVPVVGDDWYERRRDDDEGRFFRSVADQGPRKGTNGTTRQGIYLFSASGKLLAFRNSQTADPNRELFTRALREFGKLPEEERKPGAVHVDDAGKPDATYHRPPPEGGLIVNVYTRILDHDKDNEGALCRGTCRTVGGEAAARDHLWLTADEVKALVPAQPRKGATFPLPPKIANRIARFHLIDNTRGEPPMWTREDVRSQEMKLTVEDVDAEGVRLRLDGALVLSNNLDLEKASRAFDVRLLGYIHYSTFRQAIDRFDLVAVGDHGGAGAFTRRARPGRNPLGVVFELASGKYPGDRVPPQAARNFDDYMGTDRARRGTRQ
jgi:hypothetical protein